MDLVGSVREPERAQARVHAGEREVVGHSTTPVRLDRPVDDPQRHVGRDHLDGGDLGCSTLVAHGVHQPGGLEGEQAGLLDLDPGVGDPLADHPLIGEWPAEGDPADDPAAHELEGLLGHADASHAVVDAPRAETGLGDGESRPLLADQVVGRYPHVLEAQLAVSLPVGVAEHREVPHDGQTGRVPRHEDHRLLSVAVSIGVGLAHHDEHPAPFRSRTGDPPFPAVEDVPVPVSADGQPDVGGVRGGDVGLRHGECGTDLALEQRHQPLLTLPVRAEEGEHLHVAGVRSRAVHRLGREVAPSRQLGQVGVVEVGDRIGGPGGGMGHEQVPEPALACRSLELLDDRGVVVGITRSPHLFLVDDLGRDDRGLQELGQTLTEIGTPRARLEAHSVSSIGRTGHPPADVRKARG